MAVTWLSDHSCNAPSEPFDARDPGAVSRTARTESPEEVFSRTAGRDPRRGLGETLRLILLKLRRVIIQPFLMHRLVAVTPRRLVIGAGGLHQQGWIPSDIEYLNLLRPAHWRRYFSDRPIDAILAEHVWEHLTTDEAIRAATVCFQYLKAGGYLRVAVPDGLHPDPEYIDWVKPGGVGMGAYDHKRLYDHRTFAQVFESCGFTVERLEYFDEEGEFHYQEWDPEDGMVHRSSRFDRRNADGQLRYTSIVLDARK